MKKGDIFPLADEYRFMKNFPHHKKIRARYTGEKRPPRKGEWFLSGAIVEAYYSPATLSQSYHIAELVEVEVKEVVTVLRKL